MRPAVLVYRHQLFVPSETFIAQQAGVLQRFRPVFAGRTLAGGPPEGAVVRALETSGRLAVARQVFLKDPRPLLRQVSADRPVLVHAHFGVEGVYALELARELGVPLITTFHGFDATIRTAALLSSRKVSWLHYALGRSRLAREGQLFLGVSDYVRARLVELGFPEDRTRTHYMGVDLLAINPRRAVPATPLVLHVARLEEVKGTRFLLEAFAGVARALPAAQLVVIGDGPLRSRLEQRAGSSGISERVRFLGVRPHREVLEWMQRASVVVVPSVATAEGRVEGLGMVALEAAATGVPIVASATGGVPEVVRDSLTGFLVPPRDAGALCDKIIEILRAPEKHQGLGRAARRMAEERFDLRRQTAALEDLYEELL
jgi:glycosyltransferase involved in cell wall biosynthesis